MSTHSPTPLRSGSRLRTRRVRVVLALLGILVAARSSHAIESEGGFRSHVASSVRGVASRETIWILSAGAWLSALGATVEDSDAQARTLDGSSLDPVLDAGNVYGSPVVLGPAALAVLGTGYASGNTRITEFGWDLATSLAGAQLMTGAIKVAVDRTRPNGDRYSFPSGHAASAFAVASVATSHWGTKTGIVMYAAAAAVAGGRMEDHFHYLSDVIFGAAIGVAAGRGVSRRAGDRVQFRVTPSSVSVELPLP